MHLNSSSNIISTPKYQITMFESKLHIGQVYFKCYFYTIIINKIKLVSKSAVSEAKKNH